MTLNYHLTRKFKHQTHPTSINYIITLKQPVLIDFHYKIQLICYLSLPSSVLLPIIKEKLFTSTMIYLQERLATSWLPRPVARFFLINFISDITRSSSPYRINSMSCHILWLKLLSLVSCVYVYMNTEKIKNRRLLECWKKMTLLTQLNIKCYRFAIYLMMIITLNSLLLPVQIFYYNYTRR